MKRSFCCAHVSRLESLVFLWRRRIYGGSCKTSVSSRVSACPLASPCLWGKLQSLACFAALTSPSLWWKLQNLSFCLSSGVAVSMGEAAKPISSRVSACPLASPCLWGKLQSLACFAALTSPCLWGKLQNLSLVSSFCLSSGVAVFVVEAAKPRLFCCAHVVSSLCLSSGVAVAMGKAAKLRLFCCAHVAVSLGEAAKLQSRLEFLLVLWRRRIYSGNCKTSFVLLRSRRLEFLLVLWRRRVYGESCKTSCVLLRTRRRVYGGSCKTSCLCKFCSKR